MRGHEEKGVGGEGRERSAPESHSGTQPEEVSPSSKLQHVGFSAQPEVIHVISAHFIGYDWSHDPPSCKVVGHLGEQMQNLMALISVPHSVKWLLLLVPEANLER